MKSAITSLLLLFATLAVMPVMAVDILDPPTTTNSSPLNFCDKNAEAAINDLNKLSLEKLEEIKKAKAEINNLNSKKILIDGFLKMKGDFEKSYQAIANQKEASDKNLSNNLDNFKKLLNTSLTLSMVNIVAQSDKSAIKVKTIEDLCKDPKNMSSNFCTNVNDKIFGAHSPENTMLNKTLENVNAALKNNSNPENIKKDLEAIYNSIPSSIAPDKIVNDLKKFSPSLLELIEKTEDKETIIECLTDNSKKFSCLKLMEDPKKREGIANIVMAEMNNTHKEFTKNKLDTFFATLDNSNSKKSSNNAIAQQNLKVDSAVSFLEMQKDSDSTKDTLDEFNNACKRDEDKSFNKSACEASTQKIMAMFQQEAILADKQLQDAVLRLNSALNISGTLDKYAKLKEYVAQKYARNCANPVKQNEFRASGTCTSILQDGIANNLQGTSGQIGQLNVKLANIVGKMIAPTQISTQTGELGPFTKQELQNYKNTCNNISRERDDITTSICSDITKESYKISNQLENSEWKDFKKKYYVQYDKTSPKGYSVTEKKSNAEILGVGLLQGVANFIPMWFQNQQFNYQLGMMTDQAMYMKQYNYMYNPTSPWMMNYGYFQGNYYGGAGMNSSPQTNGFNFAI